MLNQINTIKEKIKEYILETSYVSPDKIMDDTKLFSEGIFDSMGFILLINFIEDSFLIKTNDAELLEENFESINSITQFVLNKIN